MIVSKDHSASRRHSARFRWKVCTLLLGLSAAAAGCDSQVGGVTFASGLGVSDEQAFHEGLQAAQRACETNTRQIVKYKSGTNAEAAWIRGHSKGLVTFCPHRM